jgi:hypothetical protein
MRHLKLYEQFEDIDAICRKHGIENYVINSDLSISVEGNVELYVKGLTKLPVKFKEVSGDFWCGGNNFWVYMNDLTSLEGCPERVGGHFGCSNNNLTSLEGCPKYIGGDFNCYNNNIYTFEGIPDYTHIGGYFYCFDNLVYNIWRLFKDHNKFEFFNDCSPIRWMDEKPTVILDRLNYFLEETGKETVENVEGYINI